MPTGKLNILIVEDDVKLRTLLSAILTQAGYGVRSAEDGFSALAEIRGEIPDIILSDLYMAGMSGFEFLSVVRRRFPAIRVVAMSSAYSGVEIPAGIAADAFYEKATKVVSLLQILEGITPALGVLADPHPSGLAPIWIDAPEGEVYVNMSCPECLRTFQQVMGKTLRVIHMTGCVYCRSLIHYAIVEPVLLAAVQAIRPNLGAEMATTTADLLDRTA